jgi:stage III sporulation protein AB
VILKILGAVLVCGASALLGMYFGSMETFRMNDLNEWKKALLILRSEIAFASTPLPEAMEHMAERTMKPARFVFQAFAENLSGKSKDSVPLLWRESIDKWKKQSFLAREDWEWLYAFGNTLGYLDKSMQISTIDMTISYIGDKVEFLEKHSEKNKKMYRSLGILGGLLLAVILL